MSDDGRFLAGALVGALALGALARKGSNSRRPAREMLIEPIEQGSRLRRVAPESTPPRWVPRDTRPFRWRTFQHEPSVRAHVEKADVETVLSLAPKRPPRGSSLRRVAPRARSDSPPHFERILVLSTGHLSKEEADLLEDGSCRPTRRRSGGSLLHVVCAEDEYGWFVLVPGDDRALREIATADKMPILARVLKRATALGAAWVKFDADASTLEGLEIFVW